MSINIHFVGYRDILVVATGNSEVQTCTFEAIQTSSEHTRQIQNSVDPIQAYKDWVLEHYNRDDQEPIYAPDDIFCEGPVVGYETFNYGKEHLKDFEEWVCVSESNGYNIKAEAW